MLSWCFASIGSSFSGILIGYYDTIDGLIIENKMSWPLQFLAFDSLGHTFRCKINNMIMNVQCPLSFFSKYLAEKYIDKHKEFLKFNYGS